MQFRITWFEIFFCDKRVIKLSCKIPYEVFKIPFILLKIFSVFSGTVNCVLLTNLP